MGPFQTDPLHIMICFSSEPKIPAVGILDGLDVLRRDLTDTLSGDLLKFFLNHLEADQLRLGGYSASWL